MKKKNSIGQSFHIIITYITSYLHCMYHQESVRRFTFFSYVIARRHRIPLVNCILGNTATQYSQHQDFNSAQVLDNLAGNYSKSIITKFWYTNYVATGMSSILWFVKLHNGFISGKKLVYLNILIS